jgi:hypothetical protein
MIEYRDWIAAGMLMLAYFGGFALAYYLGKTAGYSNGFFDGIYKRDEIRKDIYGDKDDPHEG